MTVTDQPELDFSGLHDRVRSRDADSAWAAAQLVTDDELSELKKSILIILGEAERRTGRGLTDDEIYAEYRRRGYTPRSPQRVRTARHELTDPRIRPVPLIRLLENVSGVSDLDNAAQVWGLAAIL